ncbi:MAG: hypothetical protein MRY64_05345 [Hyphomonadaceae bacterium]|nr:hypothetical protein [Hyphomonadaceae bacterium]
MARQIDGRSALLRVDSVIGEARTALSSAIEAAEALTNELADVRRRQAAAWKDLADVQIVEADTPEEATMLAGLDGEVGDLVASHEKYLEQLLLDLEVAAQHTAELEAARAEAARTLDIAIETYEAKVDEVETALEEDAAYRAMVSAAAEAEAVCERARAKLELARADMQEKGEVFRTDPLFMYLWKRGYKTPDYKAGNLVRFLDGWVARLCHYEKSYRNYERLVELPEWLEGHVAAMETREDEAEVALAEAEASALKEAGGDTLSQAVEAERANLQALDIKIAEAEAHHLEISERQHAAERGEAGPAAEARARLAEALMRQAFPDLRVLAAQTVTPEDDTLVDQLVTLRRDEMAMELRLEQDKGLPARRRSDLARLEAFRRAFKAARYDSGYASFRAATLDEVIAGLVSGRVEAQGAVRSLSRGMRRTSPRTDPRFGGSDRARTIGMPDVAVGIGTEILREMGRSSRRSGGFSIGSGLPRGRQTSFPTPKLPTGGRRGKFKTGGGF